MPVIKLLWALIIPVLTIPGCTALMVTFAFLACRDYKKILLESDLQIVIFQPKNRKQNKLIF